MTQQPLTTDRLSPAEKRQDIPIRYHSTAFFAGSLPIPDEIRVPMPHPLPQAGFLHEGLETFGFERSLRAFRATKNALPNANNCANFQELI